MTSNAGKRSKPRLPGQSERVESDDPYGSAAGRAHAAAVERHRPRGPADAIDVPLADLAEAPAPRPRASFGSSLGSSLPDALPVPSFGDAIAPSFGGPEPPALPELYELSEMLETSDAPRLRLLVLEAVPHLAPAQNAIMTAGHVVVAGATGLGGADRLRAVVHSVDAMLVGLPEGAPLIEAALAMGPQRPVVIAASSGAVDAVQHATRAGADLVTLRPHDADRLAAVLFATTRLIEQRRQPLAVGTPGRGVPQSTEAPSAAGMVPFAALEHAAAGHLARAARHDYPLVVAVFGVQSTTPTPPGLRGLLRARAGKALVQALRDIDLAAELAEDRLVVLMPYTERATGADLARRIIGAVAAGEPALARGQTFAPRAIGAVVARSDETRSLAELIDEAGQLLEQVQVTGASLAVAP